MREGTAGQADQVRPTGTLKGLVQSIYNEIATTKDGNQEICRHISRLLQPVPTAIGNAKGAGSAPIADNIEADLTEILRQLQTLRDEVAENANRLNSAV